MVIAQSGTRLRESTSLSRLRQLTDAIVDLFFPPHCVGCHRLGSWLCESCISQVETIQPPICPRCGRPIDALGSHRATTVGLRSHCGDCDEAPLALDAVRAFAYFGGPLREAIHRLKYDGVTVLADPLGQLMARAWPDLAPEGGKQVDAIVPIPLHPSRERERGYNQAALLARALGRNLNRPVVEDVLGRTRATAPQVDLGTQERRANVHDAFRCAGSPLSGRSVLLIDDVCTTGATLEAAASALRVGGVSAVFAYTLARAR